MQLARCVFVDGTYLLEILLIYPSTQAKLAGPAYLDGLVRKDPTPLLRRQRGTTPLSYVVRGATPFSSLERKRGLSKRVRGLYPPARRLTYTS